ncbi:MAG TPA: hypothetical protein PLO10_06880 [Rectinema sp.]|nr:hypothetical protein [Rectinema sp.]HQQ31930.1 hypothetical protein [Rectinema sp.]
MYLSYIDKVMHDQGLYKNYALTELLDELDVIECYRQIEQKNLHHSPIKPSNESCLNPSQTPGL